ncbi:MAG: glutathione S-transferase family protein [Hyphomicrobiaceae bacterium]
MPRLTQFRICPHSRSIRLALGELGIDCEMAEERPWEWRPAFLELNPAGSLPTLETDEGAVIAGAYAISEYLAETVDTGGRTAALFPGDARARAEVRRLVDWFHVKMDVEVTGELLREKLYPRLQAKLAAHTPDLALVRAIKSNLRHHLAYVDHLSDQHSWLAGDELSFADLAAAAHLSCIDYLDEMPWDAHPAAKTWYAKIKSRPSFRALLADRVPGLPPPMHYGDLDF